MPGWGWLCIDNTYGLYLNYVFDIGVMVSDNVDNMRINPNRKEDEHMLRTKLARQVLTKAEQRHLTKDANVHSMAGFMRTIKQQRLWEAGSPAGKPTCFTCAAIARKLGV